MSKIDYQVLREAAVAIETVATPQKLLAFRMKVTPQVVLALLDERDALNERLAELEADLAGLAEDHQKATESIKQADAAVKLAHEKFSALAAENAGMKSDIPLGAIENGIAFADRLENYQFECEGGNLNMCSDWQEFRRCFEYLSEWAMHSQTEHPATDAFLSELRAQGVEMFGQYHNFSKKLFIQKEAQKFAAQLRKGGNQ